MTHDKHDDDDDHDFDYFSLLASIGDRSFERKTRHNQGHCGDENHDDAGADQSIVFNVNRVSSQGSVLKNYSYVINALED